MKTVRYPRISMVILSIGMLIPVGQAASLEVEAGMAYVDVSGVRPYAAGKSLNENTTSSRAAPLLRLIYRIDESWSVGMGYVLYYRLQGSGLSPNTNVFGDGDGGGFAAEVPLASSERIRDVCLDLRYRYHFDERFSVEVGPMFSGFFSKAHIYSTRYNISRKFRDSELKLGGAAQFYYRLDERWHLGLGYRLAKPTRRTLSLISLSTGFSL